jgi:RNA polymerase sigma-70 factor (ECF subfamily)
MDSPSKEFRDGLVELLPRMWRFSVMLTRDRERADDLLQSACERALSRHVQFRPGTRLDSWMYSIIHSIWKNDIRRENTRRDALVRMPETPTSVDGERVVTGKIFLSEVLSQVETLPEQQASAVLLVYVDGLSYDEAASVLDVPVGTVMSRLARARLALGRALDGAAPRAPRREDKTEDSAEADKEPNRSS